jgi:hypothetical protein
MFYIIVILAGIFAMPAFGQSREPRATCRCLDACIMQRYRHLLFPEQQPQRHSYL